MPGRPKTPRLGIAARLLLSFAGVALLVLVSGGLGLLSLRNIETAQSDIVNQALPAVIDAQAVAETSAQIIARGALLTQATSHAARQSEAEAIAGRASALENQLARIEVSELQMPQLPALRDGVKHLLANLEQQNRLVEQSIQLSQAMTARIDDALLAAQGLSQLAETLVSNAASGTTAVISNLYELIESQERLDESFDALDRLLEEDVYLLERMFELRMRSSEIGLLLNQLRRAESAEEIAWIESTFDFNLRILKRRVAGISDPVRHEQAGKFYQRLTVLSETVENNIFAQRRLILANNDELTALALANQDLSDRLSDSVAALVLHTKTLADSATSSAEQAVQRGLLTVGLISVLSFALAGFIIWFYLQRNVIRRLTGLAGAMNRLAEGDLAVPVPVTGRDELTEMAGTVQVFKEQAIVKRELEKEREQTEIELRRHKGELEELVHERTEQLVEANERLQQEVEKQEEARQIAERASQAKSEFLAAMSHEIRTPMSGILGMLRIIGDSQLSESQRQRLSVVRSSGQTLLSILNDILDYSKIESGEIDVQPQDFDLRQLIDDLIAVMRFRAVGKDVQLSAVIADDVPSVLKGDSGKLSQILLNLIGNGIKFTDQGHVTLSISRQSVLADGASVLQLQVADSGPGIATEDQKRLFEAFYQGSRSKPGAQEGTGLGLAICKRLTDAMGGEIAIDSTPGQGTTVTVTLALEIGDEAAIAPSLDLLPRGDAELGRKSVLLVEDNDVNAVVVRTFLETLGHEVTLVTTGEDAVETFAAQSFEVVLMDISLPGIDGIEATRRIREQSGGAKAEIPIIAMSAHVFQDEIAQHLDAGMDAFIGKPVSPERLAEALRDLLLYGQRGMVLGPAERGNGEAPLIDGKILRDDFLILGSEKTNRMVEAFNEGTSDKAKEIAEALEKRDWDQAAKSAHNLKGSAGSLGLIALEEAAQNLESTATKQDGASLDDQIDALEALIEQSMQALESAWLGLQGGEVAQRSEELSIAKT